jgi:hypothetical protein
MIVAPLGKASGSYVNSTFHEGLIITPEVPSLQDSGPCLGFFTRVAEGLHTICYVFGKTVFGSPVFTV